MYMRELCENESRQVMYRNLGVIWGYTKTRLRNNSPRCEFWFAGLPRLVTALVQENNAEDEESDGNKNWVIGINRIKGFILSV